MPQNTKDYTFYTPIAETTCITEPKGFASGGRMLSFILKHQLLMEKLEPDALSTPFPNQVNEKTTHLFPCRSCHQQALLDTSTEQQQIYAPN